MKNGYCHSSGKKYAKMVLFGLKTHFDKNFLGYFYPPTLPLLKKWVKMVPKQVFTGGALKFPPYSMSILEAAIKISLMIKKLKITGRASGEWFVIF